MQKLNIVHPYGLIGDLPDYNKNNDIKSIKFGQDPLQLRPEQLIDLATNIKIFTQQLEDEKILHTMSSLVSEAETIVFLGFAFHEQNMELLKPSPNNHVKNVYATLKGVSESDSLVIESQITRMFNTRNRRLVPPRLNLKNMTCSQLFYDFYRSIGS